MLKSKQTGMTLIELLITVAIIGILGSVAYPSYQAYVAQANRAEAKGILLENAQFLERNYTTNNCYHRTDSACATAAAIVALPYAQAPKMGTSKYTITAVYNADLAAACATFGQCYTLSATPTGSMTSDQCGTLTLDQAGRQGAANIDGDGSSVNDPEDNAICWQR
jgi:type IV pilus assembly protein PilE